MTYTTLQYEGNPQCRACGRTTWSRNSACCECDTACCDRCASVLPTDELVCFRCKRDWFHCENCGSTRESVRRDAELMVDQQGFPVLDTPVCCEFPEKDHDCREHMRHHMEEFVETHGLECGPFERWTEEWWECSICGAHGEDLE